MVFLKKKFSDPLLYFFINKTAYSGMVRSNSKGEFNVPYGRYKNLNCKALMVIGRTPFEYSDKCAPPFRSKVLHHSAPKYTTYSAPKYTSFLRFDFSLFIHWILLISLNYLIFFFRNDTPDNVKR